MKSICQNCKMPLELGHSDREGRGIGQRTKETLSEANEVYHQHGVNSTGYGPRYIFQNVFGDKDAKLHVCRKPNAGKDL